MNDVPTSATFSEALKAERRIAVVGAGAWGLALAHHLGRAGQPVSLWCRRPEEAARLSLERSSPRLPGLALQSAVEVCSDLGATLDEATMVVLATPCNALRGVLESARGLLGEDSLLVSAAKGIETNRLLLTTEIIRDVVGECPASRLCVLSGPSFALEVAAGSPTSVVAASEVEMSAVRVQVAFSHASFRVYTSSDPTGVQVAGALKNVIAIAVGASDGLGLGSNARAALITRALAEVGRLATARGGGPNTVFGLAGLGDLVLTCTGDLSRNRTVGYQMARGRTLEQVLSSLGHVAEGVDTARSVHEITRSMRIDLPICAEVWNVLYDGKDLRSAVEDLLARPLKSE